MGYITFENVCKHYQTGDTVVKAVDNVSFTIEKGEFCVVLGPSGAGKTTVLNLLGGMDKATSGKIAVDGREITGLRSSKLTEYRRHDVGFVFQFYNLMPNLTALENVELARQVCRSQALDPRTVMEQVGLGERMQNFPAQLSGGEQQRVSIARAVQKPSAAPVRRADRRARLQDRRADPRPPQGRVQDAQRHGRHHHPQRDDRAAWKPRYPRQKRRH